MGINPLDCEFEVIRSTNYIVVATTRDLDLYRIPTLVKVFLRGHLGLLRCHENDSGYPVRGYSSERDEFEYQLLYAPIEVPLVGQ